MKTILITGSARGIGKATAILAAKRGYKVIVHGHTDSEELSKTVQEVVGSVKTFFDVSDKEAVFAAIEKLGPIDILVNNAGIGKAGYKDVSEIDENAAVEEYKVNVLGTLHCIQAVLQSMLKSSDCSIVNVASIKGHYNLTSLSSLTYGVSKAGVIALTQALAKAYPQIRINSVSPGYVQTDMAKSWTPETFEKIKNGTVLERIAKPEEIAQAILFLASNEASYATGMDLLVDGGFQVKNK